MRFVCVRLGLKHYKYILISTQYNAHSTCFKHTWYFRNEVNCRVRRKSAAQKLVQCQFFYHHFKATHAYYEPHRSSHFHRELFTWGWFRSFFFLECWPRKGVQNKNSFTHSSPTRSIDRSTQFYFLPQNLQKLGKWNFRVWCAVSQSVDQPVRMQAQHFIHSNTFNNSVFVRVHVVCARVTVYKARTVLLMQ